MNPVEIYTEAGFVLAVTGAAMIFPPLALIVAAVYLAVLAFVADRRQAAAEPPQAPQ